MASSPSEHHMDRLGYRLGDRSCNFVLAATKRLERSNSKRGKAFSFARDVYRLVHGPRAQGTKSMSKRAGFAFLAGGLMLVSVIFAGGGNSGAQQIGNAGRRRPACSRRLRAMPRDR
jgi:hypothetical protein